MLFDLNFPCYLTTFSGKKCVMGKVICAFFCAAYRSSPVGIKRKSANIDVPVRGATSARKAEES
jgi:hypothetical protein